MLGGKLLTSHLALAEHCNLLVAAFSHQHYFFSVGEGIIIKKLSLHEHDIVGMGYYPANQQLYSLD